MKQEKPGRAFALEYFNDAKAFLERVTLHRELQVKEGLDADKKVITDFYKA